MQGAGPGPDTGEASASTTTTTTTSALATTTTRLGPPPDIDPKHTWRVDCGYECMELWVEPSLSEAEVTEITDKACRE